MGGARCCFEKIKSVVNEYFCFTSNRNILICSAVVVVVVGFLSLMLGQDRNWDLRNYHLYNAYAYLSDRVGLDLAPAGIQSYFPPMLDVPYYWMSTSLPPPVTAFLMGLWHGVSFILIAGIAWKALEADEHRSVRAPLLGVAGMLSAAFLSELGNTMGDASTAPWVLAAVYFSLRNARALSPGSAMLSGLCMGIAVGLKLTNSLYAVALAASLFAGDGGWRHRIWIVFIVACTAVLASIILTGWWFHHMWTTMGNPLLPQFNAWFQSPLASQTLVSDTRWLPDSIGEAIAWPFLMTLDPERVSESGLRQLVWPLLQALLIFWALKVFIWSHRNNAVKEAMSSVQRQVLVFVVTAFIIWMLVFSIHRYLVAAEMLAPLVIWLVIQHVFATEKAKQAGVYTIVTCSLVAVLFWDTWGHAGYGNNAFEIEQPEEGNVQAATVLMTGQEPQAWMLPLMSAQYRYIGVGTNSFPEGPAYLPRAQSIWGATPDRIFVILPAKEDRRLQRAIRINHLLDRYHLGKSCDAKRWWGKRLGYELATEDSGQLNEMSCQLVVPMHKRMDVIAEDERLRESAAEILSTRALHLEPESCQRKQAWIGKDAYSYQWCRVSMRL